MKRSTNIRYPCSWYDLCDDGRFPKERIKGKLKDSWENGVERK